MIWLFVKALVMVGMYLIAVGTGKGLTPTAVVSRAQRGTVPKVLCVHCFLLS